jgi:hypothetical protein
MEKINLSGLSFLNSELLHGTVSNPAYRTGRRSVPNSERLTPSETNCISHSNGLFGLEYIVTTDDMGPV